MLGTAGIEADKEATQRRVRAFRSNILRKDEKRLHRRVFSVTAKSKFSHYGEWKWRSWKGAAVFTKRLAPFEKRRAAIGQTDGTFFWEANEFFWRTKHGFWKKVAWFWYLSRKLQKKVLHPDLKRDFLRVKNQSKSAIRKQKSAKNRLSNHNNGRLSFAAMIAYCNLLNRE